MYKINEIWTFSIKDEIRCCQKSDLLAKKLHVKPPACANFAHLWAHSPVSESSYYFDCCTNAKVNLVHISYLFLTGVVPALKQSQLYLEQKWNIKCY